MQTSLSELIKNTQQGQEADTILRSCVHCGFCNATCPTYQLLGDELDGPRGRIYLIKQVLEGHEPTAKTQLHLDRCLTCRACETTCPSGVRYGELLDTGREIVDAKVARPLSERIERKLLRMVIPHRTRFASLLRLARTLRPLLPAVMRSSIPVRRPAIAWPQGQHARIMLVLEGCAQSALAPGINAAAARVLDRLGISLKPVAQASCCGALSYHLTAQDEALHFARRNIDAWWPHIEAGAESIVMTASGCGVFVKDYGRLLRNDQSYAAKAEHVACITKDMGEILSGEDLSLIKLKDTSCRRLAFHSPCTLQHGQKLNGLIENLLTGLGFTMTPVPDAHLCCGSAGTYSILQKELSQRLLTAKLDALQSNAPDQIATANIGCLTHLQTRSTVPVRHWIELVNDALI